MRLELGKMSLYKFIPMIYQLGLNQKIRKKSLDDFRGSKDVGDDNAINNYYHDFFFIIATWQLA